ncbi:class I SAM-dependent methyltransferase [Streptomyces sp. 7R007]
MAVTRRTGEEQSARWNGSAGQAWVASQAVLDQVLRPYEELLLDALGSAVGPAGHLLDVGCGTGGTTLALARRLGPGGRCVGVDISEPMITAAQQRADREGAGRRGAPVSFVRADAQRYAFEPASFDAVVSRFGVMFFDDPVAAFTRLRRAAKDTGVLRFVAWRGLAENPFMTTAERAAAPLLPHLPVRRPDEPGQFAFADPDRVRGILADSGWHGIDLRAVDVPCTMPEPELIPYFSRLGPVGQALREVDEDTRAQVVDRVRAAFDVYVHGAEVRFTGACWLVAARATPGGTPTS